MPTLLMVVLAMASGAEAQEQKPQKGKAKGTFVKTVGTHTLYGGKLTLKIEETKGKLDSYVTRKRTKGETDDVEATGWGPINPKIEKNANWFIYSESADEAWWFDGVKRLYLMTFDDHRPEFAAGGLYQIDRKSLRMIPKEVQDRLPKSFKQ
jgi:hypothetical protein